MNTIVNNIRTAFDTMLSELVALQTETLNRANAERVEFIHLLARIQETRVIARETSILCKDMAEELVVLAADSAELADKITDAIDEPEEYLPACDYEDLVGFCENCGAEVTYDDDYELDEADGSVVCANCMPATMELAESVAGA